ncbi:MAG: prolipoprotein diacylglyceryl transferase [Actinophytocola sp.]|nr:prolipoprotein diacylglyceryl transferase [Actinophytocola sp.]
MNIAAGPVLASFPSPPQGVWQLDLGFVTLPIRAYALCIIAGIIVAIWWGERRWVARGGTKGTIIDIAVFAVPFGLVGGRLYHVMTDYYRYFGEGANPVDALKIWDGGLGIWGAIALGAVGAWIACRTRGIPLPVVADAIAPGIVVAQAIGRLGNYFNQELFGRETDVPWGLEIYSRINQETGQLDQLLGESTGEVVAIVHPTFLYELLWNLGVAVLLVWADRRFRLGHGRVFALYVAGYTAGRFWIEMMRTDPATDVFGVRVNVWVSVLVFLGAVVYLLLAKRRGGRESPEVARGTAESPESDSADTAASDDGTAEDTASDEPSPEPSTESSETDESTADSSGKG